MRRGDVLELSSSEFGVSSQMSAMFHMLSRENFELQQQRQKVQYQRKHRPSVTNVTLHHCSLSTFNNIYVSIIDSEWWSEWWFSKFLKCLPPLTTVLIKASLLTKSLPGREFQCCCNLCISDDLRRTVQFTSLMSLTQRGLSTLPRCDATSEKELMVKICTFCTWVLWHLVTLLSVLEKELGQLRSNEFHRLFLCWGRWASSGVTLRRLVTPSGNQWHVTARLISFAVWVDVPSGFKPRRWNLLQAPFFFAKHLLFLRKGMSYLLISSS